MGVLGLGGVAWLAHDMALQHALLRMQEEAARQLDVEAARLDGQILRLDYLPPLLETSPDVMRLLDAPTDPALRDSVNRYLESLNAIAGSDTLYVLDLAGTGLAAADFARPSTPIGRDLSYRPYLRDALEKGRGAFYGVGITSARAGYYISYALKKNGSTRGVSTVKVDLQPVEAEWRSLPGEMLLFDEHGIVILTSHDAWRYRPRVALSDAERLEAARAHRYGDAGLVPLDWREIGRIDARASQVSLEGRSYLASDQVLNRGRWRLVLLHDEQPAETVARWSSASAVLAAVAIVLAGYVAALRRRGIRQRLANREALQAAYESLEAKVQERTAELRAAQAELVHAEKLAALGQMSAGLVHEFNQPLAAMRTLSDNAVVLLERERHGEARDNLVRIGPLVERIARLTNQLRGFAYKSQASFGVVRVRDVVDRSLALLSERTRKLTVEVVVRVEPDALELEAEPTRLEQVFINLIGNALDALEGAERRKIEVVATPWHGGRCIVVRNSGPPIPPDILPRLFEPFVTSKPPGKGLGLGLTISAHIVREFGGRLRARNLSPSGVEFSMDFPSASGPATADE